MVMAARRVLIPEAAYLGWAAVQVSARRTAVPAPLVPVAAGASGINMVALAAIVTPPAACAEPAGRESAVMPARAGRHQRLQPDDREQ